MTLFSKFHLGPRRRTTDDEAPAADTTLATDHDKSQPTGDPENVAPGYDQDDSPEKRPHENVQHGVEAVEAVAIAWSKRSLIAVFILMWFLYLVNAFQSSILYNLTAFATSDFESHSLLTVINIVANAITAAVYIPLAKMLDLWGRAEGFLLMAVFGIIGLVVMAASQNLSTYCAAQVFYSVGFGGLIYSVDVITADASSLRNRALAYAFTSSPYIITAFAGPKASDGFYNNVNWRWGFGCFAIILPVVAAPLFFVLRHNLGKARMHGLAVSEKSGRTLLQSVWHYTLEFDAVGVILFASGLTVFLLPFTLADSAPNGWSSDYIIAMIVVGFAVLVLFGLYEFLIAPTPFLNVQSLANRTVAGACLIEFTYQVSYYCWNTYFTSFLQVVNNLTVAEAGYVADTFDVVSGVLLLFVGWLVRKTGRFRWLVFIAVPLYIFGQGLMIYFRRPNGYIGYIVMCQIFISVAGSVFIGCQQLAVLAAVDHQHVAAALALLYVVGNIGGAVGNSICGAIWTNTFEKALERYLPSSAMSNLETIYGDLPTQLSYPVGSPERLAIQESYGYAQTRMLAAGTGIMGFSFIWMFLLRDINVGKVRQTRGTVF